MFIPFSHYQTITEAPTTTGQPLLYGIFRNSANASAYSTFSDASLFTTSVPGLSSGWYRTYYSETRKLFMAVSETGPIIRSSFFTQSWSQSTTQAPGGFRDIKYIEELGMFIACGITTTSGNLLIRTSTDGVTFTTQTTPVLAGFLEDIFWSGGTAVSVSQTSRVITSNNGTTWTSRTAATGQWHGGAYSPSLNRYVIGGINGYIGYSSNAITWTVVARTGNWRYFAWSPTLGRFVGTRVGSSIAYSSDGINWTNSNSPTSLNWWNVIWVPEQSIFLATAITTQTRPVWRSSDGINWTQQTTVLGSGTWVGFAYRKEIL